MELFNSFEVFFELVGISGVLVVLFAILVIVVLVTSFKAWTTGPKLVLSSYEMDTTNLDAGKPILRIIGRRAGVLSWLLTVLGLDVEVELILTRWQVFLKKASVNGEACQTVPLPRVASVSGGAHRSVAYLVLAFLSVLLSGLGTWRSDDFTGFAIGTIVGLVFLVLFYLRRYLYLSFETLGGGTLAIRFAPSVIGAIPVDLAKVKETVTLIDDALLRSVSQSGSLSP